MSDWAKPGAKCVCIVGNGRWRHTHGDNRINAPAARDVVTVASKVVLAHGILLQFEEWPDGQVFRLSAFRPEVVRTQEQDVALFSYHLATSANDVALETSVRH